MKNVVMVNSVTTVCVILVTNVITVGMELMELVDNVVMDFQQGNLDHVVVKYNFSMISHCLLKHNLLNNVNNQDLDTGYEIF